MTRALIIALALLAAGKPAKEKPAREPAKESPKAKDLPSRGAAADAFEDAPRAAPAAPAAPTATSLLKPSLRRHAPASTACAACHATTSWSDTRFNHAKTGFPLTGQHTSTSCRACHPVDFQRSVPSTCSGCHLDLHAGELGGRCEGCHDPESWRSRFPADAHRFTGFPLVGRHAALPCGECHFSDASGRYSRAVSGCADCHPIAQIVSAIDHNALGPQCQSCHQTWTFRGARFPAHDACFLISSGSHAQFTCADCHQSFPATLQVGTCSTGSASCIDCHTGDHLCAKSDQQHQGILGYQCANQRCVGCHKEGR